MAEREAFIRAIAEHLYDDTPRLAVADWLDEHGDHARAEFIRVQCELEPIRDKYEIPRAMELHAKENELLRNGEWLGAMPKEWNGLIVGISVEFRRGFADILRLSAKMFLEHGEAIRALHPTIRRAVIHCLNGWGERLAAAAALAGLAELELACWYADNDMKALAASPHLAELQVLELWLGGGTDANLCKLAAKAKAWPKLRELTLLDPRGNDEKAIKKIVTSVNRTAKRKLARYERGYPEVFPLNGAFYYDWPVAGRLADGRAAVVERGDVPGVILVRTFDAAGSPTGEEIRLPLPDELANASDRAAENWDCKYTQVATAALGFTPGLIRVKAYALGDDFGPRRGHYNDWDMCGQLDDPENPTDYSGDAPNGIGGCIYHYVRNVEFVVGYDAWADKRGEVHST